MVLASTSEPRAGTARGARVAWLPTVTPGSNTELAPRVPCRPILMGAHTMVWLSIAMLDAILQVSPATSLQVAVNLGDNWEQQCVLSFFPLLCSPFSSPSFF